MTVKVWPSPPRWRPADASFRVRPLSQLSSSPYTGASRAATSGLIWVVEANFPAMSEEDGAEMQSFLDGLEGPTNAVSVPVWTRPSIRAVANGGVALWSDGTSFSDGTGWLEPSWDLTVAVAALAGARSLTLTGFPASEQVLWRGDVIQVGNSVLDVQSAIYSDASGLAMVPVLPGLRAGVPAATPVKTVMPRLRVRLVPDADAAMMREFNTYAPFSLRFVEAIDLP